MLPSPPDAPRNLAWGALLASCLVPLSVVLLLGSDRNWDLANYHLYNPHAWLTGRYASDVAAAQIQSWHNPLLDVPLYLMVRADAHSLLITLWLTLPAIIALLAGTRILGYMRGRPASTWESVLYAIAAGTGAAFMPTIGTALNDAYVAAGALIALAIAMRPHASASTWLWAGFVAGVTAGLKLTAAIYCIGLLAAALAAGRPREMAGRIVALGIGGLVGFLLAYLPWGLFLWESHQSPTFPYFNNVFHSPDMPPASFADERFRPQSPWDALLAPFRLLTTSTLFSELPARDPRMLVGIVGAIALVAGPRGADARLVERWRMAAAFFFASFALWLVQYGILRYTAPLELLAVAIAFTLLSRLPERMRLPAMGGMVAVLMPLTLHPDWGRRPFERHFLAADWPELPQDAMILTGHGEPLGFFALGIPRNIPIIATSNNIMSPRHCNLLQATAESRITAHRGSFWLLAATATPDGVRASTRPLEQYGLSPSGECVEIRSSFGPLALCPVARNQRATSQRCTWPPDPR